MSTMAATTRRPRRQFDDDFRTQALQLVFDEGKTVAAAARDLALTQSALRTRVVRARADRTRGRTGLTTAEREELVRLRKENRELRIERDILKKRQPSSRSPSRKVRVNRRREDDYPVVEYCRALRVSRSGIYAWRDRAPSAWA